MNEEENNHQTTAELREVGLYYISTDIFNIKMFYKTRGGNFKEKVIYKNKYLTEYIKHRGVNYSLYNIGLNIFKNESLEKGIDKKHVKRKRNIVMNKRISTLDKIVNLFKRTFRLRQGSK